MPGRLGIAEDGGQGLPDLVGQGSEFPGAVRGQGRWHGRTLLPHTFMSAPATRGWSTARPRVLRGRRVLWRMGAIRRRVHMHCHEVMRMWDGCRY